MIFDILFYFWLVTCWRTGYWYWFWVWNLPKYGLLSHSIINVPPHLRIGIVHFCHFFTLPKVYILIDLDTRSCCALLSSYLIHVGDSGININIFSHSSVASGLCIAANRKPGDHVKLPGAWAVQYSYFVIYLLYETSYKDFRCSINYSAQRKTCLFSAYICFLVILLGRLLVKRQDYAVSDTIWALHEW